MQWDVNEGRWTTVLPDGAVAHAYRVGTWWELSIPAHGVLEVVRNPGLRTWLTARQVVERVIRAHLQWEDPHAHQAEPAGTRSVTGGNVPRG